MFGYVRPLKGELRVWEYEHFKAEYCGLCHTMKRQYGVLSTLMLNYDMTFLAVLLSGFSESVPYERRRCASSPIKKKCVAARGTELDACAAMGVILGYWKLDDSVRDRSFFASIPYRAARAAVSRAYRKAAGHLPEFAELNRTQLERLWALEAEGSDELDAAADTFALILAGAAALAPPEFRKDMHIILYHVGRWVYIADACDDVAEDLNAGAYNAVLSRFSIKSLPIPAEIRDYLRVTMDHSLSIAWEALGRIKLKSSVGLVENYISLGLPFIADRVLEGAWNKKFRKSYDKAFSE